MDEQMSVLDDSFCHESILPKSTGDELNIQNLDEFYSAVDIKFALSESVKFPVINSEADTSNCTHVDFLNATALLFAEAEIYQWV